MSELADLFDLLETHCTNGQLRNAVRVYRPSEKEFPVSVNREQLLASLRKLVDSQYLPVAKIEQLLARAEENGRQHILLYVPESSRFKRNLDDFDAVSTGILGGKSPGKAGLPKFLAKPAGIVFADMRREERLGTKYKTWICKQYSGATIWEMEQSETHGDRRIDTFRRRFRRDVLLIKWHSFGLLELRIPVAAGSSVSKLKEHRKRLLKLLADGIEGVYFKELSLKPAVQRLAEAARKGEKWLRFNSPVYEVDGHNVEVFRVEDAENLFESRQLREAHRILKDVYEGRIILSLPDEHPDLPQQLAVDLCMNFENEIRIAAQTTPEAVEFVIRRLWERVKDEKLPPSPVDSLGTAISAGDSIVNIDFDTFSRQQPGIANAILRIAKWAQAHPTAEFLEPRRLAKTIGGGLGQVDFAVAVAKMVEAGLLHQKYKVRPAHQRSYVDNTFDSLDDISKAANLTDRRGQPVDLDEAEIVPVFGKASGD